MKAFSDSWSWLSQPQNRFDAIAFGTCLVAPFGTCAVATGAAFALRAYYRVRGGGWTHEMAGQTIGDAIFTLGTLGVGGAVGYSTKATYSFGFSSGAARSNAVKLNRWQSGFVGASTRLAPELVGNWAF